MRDTVGGIVLAAGLSTRMGTFKPLIPIEGEPMVSRVVRTLLDAGLAEVSVVVGHRHGAVEQVVAPLPVHTVLNLHYKNGEMLDSVRVGLRTLSPGIEAAIIALGDQPFVSVRTVRALVKAFHDEPARVYRPRFCGRHGHPVLLDHGIWPDVFQAPRGSTLRHIIHRHRAACRPVAVEDPGILLDMDRPEDLLA